MKNLEQRFKSAVFATVPKTSFVCVERDSFGWFLVLWCEGEFGQSLFGGLPP
jgi:hypothetical protein